MNAYRASDLVKMEGLQETPIALGTRHKKNFDRMHVAAGLSGESNTAEWTRVSHQEIPFVPIMGCMFRRALSTHARGKEEENFQKAHPAPFALTLTFFACTWLCFFCTRQSRYLSTLSECTIASSLKMGCAHYTYASIWLATSSSLWLPTYLPTYLPTNLPTYLPTYLSTGRPTYRRGKCHACVDKCHTNVFVPRPPLESCSKCEVQLLLSYITAKPCTCMYYYTPLPLNLANNKQQASKQKASKQATLLFSVLAITLFQHFGLYSALAIPEPRWCPCQIQVLSRKLIGGAPGRGRPVGRCPPKTTIQ